MKPFASTALALAACALATLAVTVAAQAPAASATRLASEHFLDAPGTAKHVVMIVGPSVGAETVSRFRQWAHSLHDILIRDYGYSNDSITLLHDPDAAGANSGARADGVSDREGIEAAFAGLQARLGDGDQLTVYLIGHGSGAGEQAKFHIVGPDFSGGEFGRILDAFQRQSVVVINTTSASYGFSTFLSGEGRVVISATRSAAEKYDPVFSRHFIKALDGRAADLDRNGRVSMLEAFQYAKAKVEQWYEQQGRLASEHAGLDDNGDSTFSLDPGPGAADGSLAEIAYIDIAARETLNLTGEALELRLLMQQLERSVFLLRSSKSDYLEADYWRRMENLLVELARATARFNELQ